jgi:gluconate 5-dehydrogenase
VTHLPDPNPTFRELFSLEGRVALVTGASGYLGQAMTSALAEAGATVVVSSRDHRRAEGALGQLPGSSGSSGRHAVTIDYQDEASIVEGYADAVKQAGRVAILVNNGHAALASDWTSVTYNGFASHQQQLAGYFLLSRLVRDDAVRNSQPASIINIGSMYGVVGSYPEVYRDVSPVSPVAYHALKGGIVQMTRHLAVCWAKDDVRVNCLSPGPFPKADAPRELVARLRLKSPMGRMGLPWELKGPLLLLASDAGSYITGQNLLVDGGWTAW